jgi:hypothetical protein
MDGLPLERIRYPKIHLLGAVVLCLRFAWKLLRERGRYDAVHVHMAENLAAIAAQVRPWLGASVTVKVSGASEFDGGIDFVNNNRLEPRSNAKEAGKI